jgi:hypothetical protein
MIHRIEVEVTPSRQLPLQRLLGMAPAVALHMMAWSQGSRSASADWNCCSNGAATMQRQLS